MSFENESYHIYIQRIKAIYLQLQDINPIIKATINFIDTIKDHTPITHFKTLQQLTLTHIIEQHIQDLSLTNQKVDMALDILLCQAPRIDHVSWEYKHHVEVSWSGSRHIFDNPVVLTHLQYVIYKDGSRGITNVSEHLPPTRELFQDHCPEPILNPEYLPIKESFEVKIPHLKPRF